VIVDEYVDSEDYPVPYYLHADQGYGTCDYCGSALENSGLCSDGDGDLYDSIVCPNCQEERGRANERWLDEAGHVYASEEDMYAYGEFSSDSADELRSLPGDLAATDPSNPVDDIPW
jgi:hypothetical protein